MRLFLLLMGFSAVGLISGQAQPNIGLYSGVSNGTFSGDAPDDAKYNGKLGGTFGANIDFKLTEEVLLSFQPGFNNINVGLYYLDDSLNTYKDSIDIHLRAVALPVQVNVITDNKKWYFTSGIEFASIISNTATIVDTGEEIDLDAETNDYNISINFGVTYLIYIGKPFVTIGARYSQGLVNVANARSTDSYVPRIKTNGLQLRIGVQYPLNK